MTTSNTQIEQEEIFRSGISLLKDYNDLLGFLTRNHPDILAKFGRERIVQVAGEDNLNYTDDVGLVSHEI